LANAYFAKLVTLDMALSRSSNPDELQDMINRGVATTPSMGKGLSGKSLVGAKH
jgi:hypothetical protein